MNEAGIPVMRHIGEEFQFHDLRHTGAMLLMESGVNLKLAI
jgi:integrase